jgi:subtilisin family serine protease
MRRTWTLTVSLLLTLLLAAPAPAAPSDTHWELQWGPRQINAPQAWATSTGEGQTIAIVDSGVDLDHPDLAAKIAGGATFVGCPDDPSGCGDGDWESGTDGGEAHGTHVAGIAGAVTGNGAGIAGVAPDAKLLAVKVLDEEGAGSFEEIAAGIRWSADHGADVINLSLGALPGVQALVLTGVIEDVQRAIAYARSQGVVVVAAAGNEFASICGTPASDTGALCVTATDRDELKAAYSNLGVSTDLDVVAAPGGALVMRCEDDIVSTVPLDDAGTSCQSSAGTPGYDFYAGTSMAAPHVSGVAALLTAQGRSDDEVVEVLKATARTPPVGVRGVYDPVYGFGIVDAGAAVADRGTGAAAGPLGGAAGG